MDIKAIAFDVNGTLVDIVTEDDMEAAFRAVGHFLTYQGVDLRRHQVRDLYFRTMKQQQRQSPEQYPEFDAVGIWRTILTDHLSDFSRGLPGEQLAQLPLFLAEMYRGITRRRLRLYPHVLDALDALRSRYRLAVVTDGQSSYARGELHKVGLIKYFDPIIVSGDHGFRKPDRRLFQFASDGMGIAPENTIYIGNDMHRDIFGARGAGMRTIMFHSAHGAKHYEDCVPDHTAADWRDVLRIIES